MEARTLDLDDSRARSLARAAAVALAGVGALACVLALSWLAVVITASGEGSAAEALPWAIGCAVTAVAAFAAALGAMLTDRRRALLLGASGLFLALLVTAVLGLAMSGSVEEVEVPATDESGRVLPS